MYCSMVLYCSWCFCQKLYIKKCACYLFAFYVSACFKWSPSFCGYFVFVLYHLHCFSLLVVMIWCETTFSPQPHFIFILCKLYNNVSRLFLDPSSILCVCVCVCVCVFIVLYTRLTSTIITFFYQHWFCCLSSSHGSFLLHLRSSFGLHLKFSTDNFTVCVVLYNVYVGFQPGFFLFFSFHVVSVGFKFCQPLSFPFFTLCRDVSIFFK